MPAVPHWYASLAQVKRQLRISDTTDDEVLKTTISNVSRQIDQFCDRHFFPIVAVKYFETDDYSELSIPGEDLLSVTTLEVDQDDDGTYEESWASNTYVLCPRNAATEYPSRPYWEVEVPLRNTNYFPVAGEYPIKITGLWGYYNQLTATTTVHSSINSSATLIALHNASTLLEVGQTILIDAEQMFITVIAGVNVTVTRACNGTTGASHAVDAVVSTYTYPVIGEAATHQAVLAYRQTTNPYGTVGVGEVLTEPRVMTAAGLHPFVRGMIAPLKRLRYDGV
jgi:hypothetical protein